MAADMSRLASADADMATCPAPRGQCIPAVGGAGIAVAMRGAREKLGVPAARLITCFSVPVRRVKLTTAAMLESWASV